MTRISQWLQHDERLLTPDTGSTSPAMDYTIILVGVLARVDAACLFLAMHSFPRFSEDRLHVNCRRTCPTLRLLVVWHDCNCRSVMQPYGTFTYRPIADFFPSSLVAMFLYLQYRLHILILHPHPRFSQPHAKCHDHPSPFLSVFIGVFTSSRCLLFLFSRE